jgi:hypothetical protein
MIPVFSLDCANAGASRPPKANNAARQAAKIRRLRVIIERYVVRFALESPRTTGYSPARAIASRNAAPKSASFFSPTPLIARNCTGVRGNSRAIARSTASLNTT